MVGTGWMMLKVELDGFDVTWIVLNVTWMVFDVTWMVFNVNRARLKCLDWTHIVLTTSK